MNELEYGMRSHELRDDGQRIRRLFEAVRERLAPDILPFDEAAARACAEVSAHQAYDGRKRPPSDMLIIGICLVHGAAIATRNTRHLDGLGVELINPFDHA